MELPGYYYDADLGRYFKGTRPKIKVESGEKPERLTLEVCHPIQSYSVILGSRFYSSTLFPEYDLILCSPHVRAMSPSGRQIVVTDHVTIAGVAFPDARPSEVSGAWIDEQSAVISCGTDLDYRKRSYILTSDTFIVMDQCISNVSFNGQCIYISTDSDQVISVNGNWSWQFKSRVLSLCTLQSTQGLLVSTLGSQLFYFKNMQRHSIFTLEHGNADQLFAIDPVSALIISNSGIYLLDLRWPHPMLFLSRQALLYAFNSLQSSHLNSNAKIEFLWVPINDALFTYHGNTVLVFKLNSILPISHISCPGRVLGIFRTNEGLNIRCEVY